MKVHSTSMKVVLLGLLTLGAGHQALGITDQDGPEIAGGPPEDLAVFTNAKLIEREDGVVTLQGIGVNVEFSDVVRMTVDDRTVTIDYLGANVVLPEVKDSVNDLPIEGDEYVVYRNLYDGIDLVFSILGGRLKSNYIVREGATASSIQLRYSGHSGGLSVEDNELTVGDQWKEENLVLRDMDGSILQDELQMSLRGDVLHYHTGARTPFVIDPDYSFMVFGNLLGGSGADLSYDIVVDSSGNVYITGGTSSTNFPVMHAYQSTTRGYKDAFVASFNASGELRWATYLGGSSDDEGRAIVVDSSGNVYVTGTTGSLDFPVLGPHNSTFAGGTDIFVTSFTPSGEIRWSTYLGGEGIDYASDVAADPSGNLYLVGLTDSVDFPTLNASQEKRKGPAFTRDAFVTSLTSSGEIRWSTYLGGTDDDLGTGIALDPTGNIYVTGATDSSDFPTLNPYSSTSAGMTDVFITSFTPSGEITWSTYLGGSDVDRGFSLTLDSSGNIYVTGVTDSSDFPTLSAYSSSYRGRTDTFVTSFNTSGDMRWSTYLGGSYEDYAYNIALDTSGNVLLTGMTGSRDFPTPNAYNSTFGGRSDTFVTSFNATGTLNWSTYLGGPSEDRGFSLTPDPSGNILVTGTTTSSNFPATPRHHGENLDVINLFVCAMSDPWGDRDNDHMPNFYEYQNGLDIDRNDADEDKDGDGLTNLEEYLLGSSASNTDSDGDGIPDDYEHRNGLDVDNTGGDKDHDLIPDVMEYQLHLNPSSPVDGILVWTAIILLTTGTAISLIRKLRGMT